MDAVKKSSSPLRADHLSEKTMALRGKLPAKSRNILAPQTGKGLALLPDKHRGVVGLLGKLMASNRSHFFANGIIKNESDAEIDCLSDKSATGNRKTPRLRYGQYANDRAEHEA